MHPVLASLPWPELGIPLWPVFALLASWGVATGAVALRHGNRSKALLGGLLTVTALVALFTSDGSLVTPGPFELRAWGVFFATSLALGSALVMWRGTAVGLEREPAARLCIAAAVGGVIGARVVWVLLHPAQTESIAGTVAFYRGGLSVWGGLAGAVLGAKFASRESKIPFFQLLDLGALGFGVGVFLTRVGCQLEGCDFGVPLGERPAKVLAALGTFPKGSPAWVEHVLTHELPPTAAASLPVHPTAVYEAIGGVLLVLLAFSLERRKVTTGFVFGGVVLAYLLLRVTLDSLREDPVEMWVSCTLVALALGAGAVWKFRHGRSPLRK